MKSMKRFLFILFTVIGILTLVACSSGEESNQANNTKDGNASEESADVNDITVWAWDPNFNIKALEIAKEYYQKENSDVNINIVENAQEDIIQKLNTTLSSGSTQGLPNIVLIEDYRAQSFLQAYPDAFYDLTDYFNQEDFADYKLSPTSYEGKNYGLPFDSGVTGLYVRTDYLEEAGFTLDDLQGIDWWKYIEIGKKVKEATGKDFLTEDPNDLRTLRIMIQSAGVWYMEDDGETPYIENNEALKEAFELYKAMLEADIVKPNSDFSQLTAHINNGDIVTLPMGNWITPSVKAEESQAGKWAIVPIPKPTVQGATHSSNLGGSSWYVLDIPGAEHAADFLSKTFGSNTDFYQDLLLEVGAIGTFFPAMEGEAYKVEDEFFQNQQIYADLTEWMEEVPSINYGLHTYLIDDIITIEMQNYIDGKDLSDVLSDAQAQAESQLK